MGKNKRHHGSAPVVLTAPFGKNQPDSENSRQRRIHLISLEHDLETTLNDIDIKKNQFTITANDLPSDFLETAWAKNFEAPYGTARDAILREEWPLDKENRQAVANMFSACLVKNHMLQEYLVKQGLDLFETVVSKFRDESVSEEIINEYHRHIKNLTKITAYDRAVHFGKLFSKYPWILIKTNEPIFTGNSSIVFGKFKKEAEQDSFNSGGFRKLNDYFIVPISPRRAIFGTFRTPNGKYLGDFHKNSAGVSDSIQVDKGKYAFMVRAGIGALSSQIYIHPDDVKFFRNSDGSIDLLRQPF